MCFCVILNFISETVPKTLFMQGGREVRRKIIICVLIMACIIIIAYGDGKKQEMSSSVSISSIGIEIEELFWNEEKGEYEYCESPTKNGELVIWGDKLPKNMRVKNSCEEPVWIRVGFCQTIVKNGSEKESLEKSEDLVEFVWRDKWKKKKEDNLYYYDGVLEGGETTEDFFESVKFKGDLVGAKIKITVCAQAEQAVNNLDNPWETTPEFKFSTASS